MFCCFFFVVVVVFFFVVVVFVCFSFVFCFFCFFKIVSLLPIKLSHAEIPVGYSLMLFSDIQNTVSSKTDKKCKCKDRSNLSTCIILKISTD